MAQATTSTFGKFMVLVGDGATPEVFTAICGLTSKGLDISADVQTSEVPDCSDEDAVSWQEQDVKSVGASISGSGVYAMEAHKMLMDWALSGAQKNVKVMWGNAEVGDPSYVQGPCVLSKLGQSVQKGQRLSADITLNFALKPAVTAKA